MPIRFLSMIARAVVLAASLAFSSLCFAAEPEVTAFVHVSVLPMDREHVLADRTVLIDKGLITAVGRDVRVPNGARVIDGTGADEELKRTITNLTDALPGEFETGESVLSAMETQALLNRPDNYYELLQRQYEGLTKAQLDAALRGVVNPDGFVWVVVGDAAKVKPQLAKLGIPVQEMQPR